MLALGKALRPKPRKILGIPVPRALVHPPHLNGAAHKVAGPIKHVSQSPRLDLDTAANGLARAGRQIGRTGRQVRKVAADIERIGQTTERVGSLLAK